MEAATGDIWSTGAFSFESPLKDLLDRGGYTLEDLLAEDELLQELRGMHPQLIDFFSTEEAVMGLIQYVTRQETTTPVMTNGSTATKEEEEKVDAPEDETPEDEAKKPGQWLFPPMEKPEPSPEKSPEEQLELLSIRYPYMACEVICCEINSIIDIVVDGVVVEANEKDQVEEDNNDAVEVSTKKSHRILDVFFSLLYKTRAGELDDFRAGYFDKILSVLFRKRPKAMSAYMNEGGGKEAVTLMTAMMDHLYSHSIMQIVQRLLLPPPSSFLTKDEDDDDDDSDKNGDFEDDTRDSLFQCHWCELPEAIDLLLNCLIVPVDTTSSQEEQDMQLSKSQNASEVLITVIQNSPLTSTTLLSLTTDPIMGRIIKAACTLEDGADFSPHDSPLTCALTVLESLVLQLGGYGSVGTALETAEEGVSCNGDAVTNGDEDSSLHLEEGVEVLKVFPELANAETLICHLPELLQSLGDLLCHPSTKTWLSPMQFSKSEEQALLGLSRLRIVRLIESLVLLGNPQVDVLLCESDCLSICLDLFWEFQWCSMLHQSVANLLVHVFEGANGRAELQGYFLNKCNLLGRLMDSFDDTEDPIDTGVLLRLPSRGPLASLTESDRHSSVAAVYGDSDNEVIPVSDDDVDAALEQVTEIDREIKATEVTKDDASGASGVADEEGSTGASDVKSSLPSLRMGCLGHVIIICQALVHACSQHVTEMHENANASGMMRSVDLGDGAPTDDVNGTNEVDENTEGAKTESSSKESEISAQVSAQGDDQDAQDELSDSQRPTSNGLVIAQLIESNPLHDRWEEFIITTLAAETAIQSTPLGGSSTSAVDPLPAMNVARSSRTYDFSEDEEEDGSGERSGNAKGFLGGGEVLDMDDNDLDIAASMMEALNLGPRPRGANGADGHNDADESSGSRQDPATTPFGTVIQNQDSGSGDYIFDDPLGGNSRFNTFGEDSSDDEDEADEGATGSSGLQNGTKSSMPGKEDEDEVPVMDLFTGNFGFDKTPAQQMDLGVTSEVNTENGAWSNFANFDANFDDAFAAANTTGNAIFGSGSSEEEDAVLANSEVAPDAFESVGKEEAVVDDLFGSTPHALLLGDDDADVNRSPEINDEPPSDAESIKANCVPKEETQSPDAETSLETPVEGPVPETESSEPTTESAVSG